MRDEIDEAFHVGKCLGRIADKSEMKDGYGHTTFVTRL